MAEEIVRRLNTGTNEWETVVADSGGGGGGSLPDEWVVEPPAVPGGTGGLDAAGGWMKAVVLRRPDDTPAIAVDGNGRVEVYYADGATLAFAINDSVDSGAIEFFGPGGNTQVVLRYKGDDEKWVMAGDLEYAGNNPMIFTGGGLDLADYDVVGVHNLEGSGGSTLRIKNTGSTIVIELPVIDPADGESLWNDGGTVKVASTPP